MQLRDQAFSIFSYWLFFNTSHQNCELHSDQNGPSVAHRCCISNYEFRCP